MMSTDMQRAHAVAEEYDKKLLATDPRFRWVVHVIHEDGSALFYRSAFLMKWKDPTPVNWGASENPGVWLFIFTEHHDFHLYPVDDLYSYDAYTPLSAPGWLNG